MCSLLKFVKLAIRAKYFLYVVGMKFKKCVARTLKLIFNVKTLSKTITISLTKTVIPLTLTLGKHQGDSSQQVWLPVKDEIIKLIAHRRANRTAFLGLSVCLTLGNGRRTSQSRKRREQWKNQPFICIEGPLSTQDQIRCPHTITENIHRA